MLKIKSLFFVGLFITLATVSVIAQTINLKSVKQEISDGKLKIDFEYEQDITAFAKSQLFYQKFNSFGADGQLQPVSYTNLLSADRTKFTFLVPSDALNEAVAIEFFMDLSDSQTIIKSPKIKADVKYLMDLNQIKKDKIVLSDENQKLRNDIEQRNQTIATLSAKIIPKTIVLEERKMLSDEKVILLFRTNVAGKIKATINGPKTYSDTQISKVVSDKHLIEFTGLQAGGGEYIVEAVALDVNDGDKEIPKVKATFDSYSKLKFKTPLEAINKPTLTINAESKTSNSIDVKVNLDQNGFVEVTCQEILDQSKGTKGRLQQIGKLDLNEFRMPTGDFVQNEKVFVCKDLNPNTSHIVTVKAVNEFGKESLPQTVNTSVITKKIPEPFEFADVLSVEMGPLGIVMKWSATSVPDADTSFLDVLFDDENFKVTKKAEVSGTSFTAQLSSIDELVSVINKSLITKKQPVFRVRMKQGNTERTRSLKVAFVLPSKQAVINSDLSKEEKVQILNVIKNAQNGKKVDWNNLLKSGLSLLAKVAL